MTNFSSSLLSTEKISQEADVSTTWTIEYLRKLEVLGLVKGTKVLPGTRTSLRSEPFGRELRVERLRVERLRVQDEGASVH